MILALTTTVIDPVRFTFRRFFSFFFTYIMCVFVNRSKMLKKKPVYSLIQKWELIYHECEAKIRCRTQSVEMIMANEWPLRNDQFDLSRSLSYWKAMKLALLTVWLVCKKRRHKRTTVNEPLDKVDISIRNPHLMSRCWNFLLYCGPHFFLHSFF